jgi:hypothetical protein
VTVRETGQLTKMSKFEAIQRTLIAKAMSGDARTTTKLLKFLERYPELAQATDGTDTIVVKFVNPPPHVDDFPDEDTPRRV